jgi:uncharacterized protein YutE (UPF0331/DUF86 family)
MLKKDVWSIMETGGMGSALGDIYKVVEHSLKNIIEETTRRKIPKDANWHQKLLEEATREGLIPDEIRKIIRGMLGYRHLDVHGYSMDVREDLIRKNAPEAIMAFYDFVGHLQEKFDIPDADIRNEVDARRK